MRPIASLVHGRTRVRSRYALMPLEGFPNSRLPTFPDAAVRVLASPRLGAEFVQMIIDLPAGKKGEFPAERNTETFYYVLSGAGKAHTSKTGAGAVFSFGTGGQQVAAGSVKLTAGSFGLLPPGASAAFDATEALSLLVLRKKYEVSAGVRTFDALHGHESEVEKKVWAEDSGALLQTLIPDTFDYDLAMNIFEFQPGHGLPIIETHVMEHGALILQGKGLYYLEEAWMEVEKDDFIYMGPYCPQSFYATGTVPAKYIYYKNVNREIPL